MLLIGRNCATDEPTYPLSHCEQGLADIARAAPVHSARDSNREPPIDPSAGNQPWSAMRGRTRPPHPVFLRRGLDQVSILGLAIWYVWSSLGRWMDGAAARCRRREGDRGGAREREENGRGPDGNERRAGGRAGGRGHRTPGRTATRCTSEWPDTSRWRTAAAAPSRGSRLHRNTSTRALRTETQCACLPAVPFAPRLPAPLHPLDSSHPRTDLPARRLTGTTDQEEAAVANAPIVRRVSILWPVARSSARRTARPPSRRMCT